jgi:iron complex outermembrane receptor protein
MWQSDPARAIEAFTRASEIGETFALPWAWMSYSYGLLAQRTSSEEFDRNYENMSRAARRGVDLQLNWGTDVGPGSMQLSFFASILDSMKTRLTPTTPWIEYKGTFGPTLPSINGGAYDYRTFTTLSYQSGDGNIGLRWRHLPSIESATAATGATSTLPTDSYDIFDVTGGLTFNNRWNFRYGIDNLLDTPPEITDATPWSAVSATNGNFYDGHGRAFYVGLNMTF